MYTFWIFKIKKGAYKILGWIFSEKVVLEKSATLDVKGNVVINGVDLEERLSTIETLLFIPTRDVKLEAMYPKLKEIYQQYMNELEKYKTFERLKGTEDD